MGFLNDLFQSKSTSETQQQAETEQQQTSEQVQTGTQAQTGTTTAAQQQTGQQQVTGAQTQVGTVQQFGEAEQQILSQLISSLGAQQAGGGGQDFLSNIIAQSAQGDPAVLQALQERATGFGEQRERIQADLRGAATQRFEETTGRSIAQQQQQIGAGGGFNTASRLLDIEGERRLGIDLAGLSAQTDLQLNQQEEAALLAALSGSGIAGQTAGAASGAPLNELLQALQISKGGQVVSETTGETQQATTSQQQQTSEQQTTQLLETLQELIASSQSTSKSKGTASTQGTSQAPILGQIVDAFTSIAGTGAFGKSLKINPIG